MPRPSQYRLLDFGDGRKLESLGDYIVDRPSPAAEGTRAAGHQRWNSPDAFFHAGRKQWRYETPWPDDLIVDCDGFVMPVRPTPYGHIGFFPEQSANWNWLRDINTPDSTTTTLAATDDAPQALNLFGYTGASTMALASVGFRVAHVDVAKPNVEAARVAAETNGRTGWPIRYLVDDAAKFAAREVRRGRSYHTIVLDPPAYGHSPKGAAWRLERDLWPLLDSCLELVTPQAFRLLVTGHSPQVDANDIIDYLKQTARWRALGLADHPSRIRITKTRSGLPDEKGRQLDAGFTVRIAVNNSVQDTAQNSTTPDQTHSSNDSER